MAQYLERWLEDAARPSVRPTTLANYRSVVRSHLVPHLGAERLVGLSPMRVQKAYTEMERAGAKPRTRQLAHAVLHRALGQAMRWGLVSQSI